MKKNQIKVGGVYTAKVSDKLVSVRIDSVHSKNGWNATNTRTGKRIHIKSAQRLRSPAKAGKTADPAGGPTAEAVAQWRAEGGDAHLGEEANTATTKAKAKANGKARAKKADAPAKPATRKASAKKADAKPKRVSALDAAAEVLAKAKAPMGAKALIEAMGEQGLWSSPAGATPHATLYAAIIREIGAKGEDARFKKVDRGQFEFAGMGA